MIFNDVFFSGDEACMCAYGGGVRHPGPVSTPAGCRTAVSLHSNQRRNS